MKGYFTSNKFGTIALALIIMTFLLIFLWIGTTNELLLILNLITFVGAIVLSIIGMIKDKKKLLSIISLVLVALIIIGIGDFFLTLPSAIDSTVERLLKSWGIGGN